MNNHMEKLNMNRIVAAIFGAAGLWFLLMSSPRSMGEAVVKYAFAAILLWFAYRRFQLPANGSAEYVKREDGAWLHFSISPASAPVLWFPAILAIGLGAGVIGSGLAYFWILGSFLAFLTWLILLKDHRGGGPSSTHEFRVSHSGIELGGTLLRKEDIHHIVIKNKFAGNIEIAYDANRGLSTGTAMGLAAREALTKVAYRVEAEAGGKAHVLASGLDETTARGLASEIDKALNPNA